MNKNSIIKLTNKIAIIAVSLFIFWIFGFLLMVMFKSDFINEEINATFSLSILLILGLLVPALVINILLTLSKILDIFSERGINNYNTEEINYRHLCFFVLSFPLIFIIFYLGDYYFSIQKKNYLVESAKMVVARNINEIERMTDYTFNKEYIEATESVLALISREDENFPAVAAIFEDYVERKKVLVDLKSYHSPIGEAPPEKKDYIFVSSKEEREYLETVFEKQQKNYYFKNNDRYFELYYPVKTSKRMIVLYFTDNSRYGKSGF